MHYRIVSRSALVGMHVTGGNTETVAAVVERVPGDDDTTNCTAIAVHHGQSFTNSVTLRQPVSYIDSDGVERQCRAYTVLQSSNFNQYYGERGAESWYVVSSNITISGLLRFMDTHAHLILCDGAALTVSNAREGDHAIDARAIFIYSQTNGTGTIVAYGSSYGIRSRSGPVIINGGCVTATATNSASRGVAAYRGLAINGGTVNAAAYSHGIFADNGDIIIKGGTTVNADGEHSYGIRAADGAITIFGGTIRVFGGSSYGIYANGNVLLGCTDPTDSICSSASYSACHAASGRVKVMPGQALIDDENNIYDDDLYEYDLTTICNKTLHPYVLSYHFKDPEGREIEDSAVLDWLKYYDMLQTDICALGNDAAATDDLYEDYLLNCDIRVWNAGGALSITAFSVSNGVVSVTVQLVRNAPMGAIKGHLYLYGANDLAACGLPVFGSASPSAKQFTNLGVHTGRARQNCCEFHEYYLKKQNIIFK